jgi:MoxR-like ATPase
MTTPDLASPPPSPAPDASPDRDAQAIQQVSEARKLIIQEVRKRIVGQEHVVEQVLIALLARGHCLLMGVPGLAKTLLVSTLAQALALNFNRIQFTPDLMPSDITGTDILEEDHATGRRFFKFIKGPIFANLLLADEINRTPPKTQAALLQSMQEYRVTAGGQTYELEQPFLVFATQNPIEQEGTYALPEAQLDRFMFHIVVDYPSFDEEVEIVRSTTGAPAPAPSQVLGPEQILALQALVRRVPVADEVIRAAVELARRTRPKQPDAPAFIREYVAWGAGPRASQYLILAAKARAILHGHFAASVQDVKQVARAVLRHRVMTNFHAEAQRLSVDDILDQLLA